MTDKPQQTDKDSGSSKLFGITIPAWAEKAKASMVETLNSEKTKAALEKMEQTAKSVGKSLNEKAKEAAKAAESLVKGKAKENKETDKDNTKPPKA